ncbi:hypothetical protein J3A83DRAFT_4369168 [Scleroderma citrinum]
MAESSQILRISRIEVQDAGKAESAQLTIGASQHKLHKRQDSNILSAEFNPPLESSLEGAFYLSTTKWKLGTFRLFGNKISIDPREVLSNSEDHQFRKVQGKVTINLEILPSSQPDTTTGAQPELPAPSIPGLLIPTTDELFRQCTRFRILIIGKTGVGKTSLINSTFGIDEAVEWTRMVLFFVTNAFTQRPEHEERGKANIEIPLYSKLNEHFVLHDSNGFESGDSNNLTEVKGFIERRKTHADVNEQLHAVWLSFQVPVERLGHRLMETGMEDFLRDKGRILGNIPTIFVFTKYDTLIDDIERRWVHENKDYTEEQLDSEADKYLKQRCIKRIQELTGQSNIPYIAVSSKSRYKDRLKQLTELTHEKVSEYFAPQNIRISPQRGTGGSAVATVTAIAQRVTPKLNIQELINVGKRRYWNAVFSGADFSGHTIKDCLDVIHTDIVKVWNFYDPSGLLLSGDFRDFMVKLIDTLDESDRHLASAKTPACSDTPAMTSEGGVVAMALIPIILPFTAGAAVIKWARETYRRVPEVQRKFIAYITDLTHVLDILFTLIASRSEKNLTKGLITTAVVVFQTSQRRRDVHTKIRELAITFFGGCDVIGETESFVKSRYIEDIELKQKVEQMTPGELEGEEGLNWPQSDDNKPAN